MPGLTRRKSSRGSRLDHSENNLPHHIHGIPPYPTRIQDRRNTSSSSSRSPNNCLPALLSNPAVSLAKIQLVKQELLNPMLPSAWSTEAPSSRPGSSSASAASGSGSGPHHNGPPPKKGKHPRRPPEAQMHHFPRKSCNECHDHKVKCVKIAGRPCERCDALGIECIFSLPKKYGRPSKTSSVASDAAANVELGPRRQQRLKRQSSLSDSQTNASTLTSEQMTSSAPSAESEMDPLSPKPVFASASASLTSLHPQATEPTANSQPGMEQHSTNSALLDASTSSTFLGQGLFQQRVFAQSPPPIGQQSFRNVRERAESVASDGHSFSSRSSSSNSLQPSRAHSGDGSQLYFDALSPAHSASEQSGSFQNSPIVATSSFAFSDLPWQQTAVTTAASWSRGSVSSVDIAAVPATTTTAASLGPLLESQASIEFDSLLNSFDATMFTAGGSDLGITAEMGLGLLPGFTGAQPAMTSQAYNDVDLSDTSLTQTLALSNQQGFGGDQKDSSPETPAASRSSLTSAILPGSSARAPGMNTAWQGQWTFDAHQRPQLVPTSQPTNTSVPLGGLGASPRTTSQALAGSLADLAAQSLGLTLDVTTPMMMFQGGPAAAPQVQRSQTAADIRWDQQQQYLQSSPQGLQGQQQQQQQQQQQYQVLLQEQQAQQQRAQQQHSYPFLDGNSWPYGPALQHNSNAELDRPAMQAASRAASAPSVIATDAFTAPSQQQQQAFASPSQRSRQQELDRLRQQWRSTYSTMFPNQPSS